MIQDFRQTVQKLFETKGLPGGDSFVPRLSETLFTFATETVRDLKLPDWRNQFHGGLNAGYILALLGSSVEAVEFLDKSIGLHRANRDKSRESESSVLEFVVQTLENFGVNEELVKTYRVQLANAIVKEKKTPEDLRKEIVHHEADMECATGDLNSRYAYFRRQQGLLYQQLNEHESAIAYFKQAIEEDRRNWRNETSIKNTLSIVDSYILSDSLSEAVDCFMELIKSLSPAQIKIGDPLPQLFTDNFATFHPYFTKLKLDDLFSSIAEHALARLRVIVPKEHQDRMEICKLTEIVAVHYVGKGEYHKASAIFDAGREQLEYKHHLSRKEQAEFAIKAGEFDKARDLIAQEDRTGNSISSDRREGLNDLVNLELQLGSFTSALDRLDEFCARHKECLIHGTFSSVFEARRDQIDIMRALIGDDYLKNVRDYVVGRADLRLGSDLKFLGAPLSAETTV